MTLDRARLARVLEMIGSSFDGEALVAARRAHALVRGAGLTWEKLLTGTPGAASDGWVEPDSVSEALDRCWDYVEDLTPWEREFIDNLAGWRGSLTEKQAKRLAELVEKVRRIARARERAA